MGQSTYNRSTERPTDRMKWNEWQRIHKWHKHTHARQSKKVIIKASIIFVFSIENGWPKAFTAAVNHVDRPFSAFRECSCPLCAWVRVCTIAIAFPCKNSNNFQINCYPIKLSWLTIEATFKENCCNGQCSNQLNATAAYGPVETKRERNKLINYPSWIGLSCSLHCIDDSIFAPHFSLWNFMANCQHVQRVNQTHQPS